MYNLYVDLAFLKKELKRVGKTYTDDDELLTAYLNIATDYIDSLEPYYIGIRKDKDQENAFPRISNTTEYPINRNIQMACVNCVKLLIDGQQLRVDTFEKDMFVKKQQLAVMEKQYDVETMFNTGYATGDTIPPSVEIWLQPYLLPKGGFQMDVNR